MENLITISDSAGLDRLEEYLKDKEFIAYDTETTGLGNDATIIGFSVAAEVTTGWYVVTNRWDNENKRLVETPIRKECVRVLNILASKSLIMHNAKVDIQWTKANFQVDLLPALHTDTIALVHLVDENKPSYGLKELAAREFGDSDVKEKKEMEASVKANGGVWEKKKGGNKEMYKADTELMARYGAKDTILTLKIFYAYVEELYAQNLDKFFYEDETMPLLKTCTYQLNTTGFKIDMQELSKLSLEVEKNSAKLLEEINFEIYPLVKEKFPGTSKATKFNVSSGQQVAWLLFTKLGNDWKKVTNKGREVSKELIGKPPYSQAARRAFVQACLDAGHKPEKYIQCDRKILSRYSSKYKWVDKLLEYRKEIKILKTYIKNINKYTHYGVLTPSFNQSGTTSGRYSSSKPNLQNLPRDDKRIKRCFISRPGKSFVGADFSQIEARVFASVSQDPILLEGFKNKDDFYSVVGATVFGIDDCSMQKKDPNYLGTKRPEIRQAAKVVALSLAYGTTPFKLAEELAASQKRYYSIEEAAEIHQNYFERYKGVAEMVRKAHADIANNGVVYSSFGRPRRVAEAKFLKKLGFPEQTTVEDLHYTQRSLLNLAVNHPIQSAAASLMNRAAIRFCGMLKEHGLQDTCKVIVQVHDELVAECDDKDTTLVASLLKDALENTNKLKGVDLIAEPVVAKNLADLK